MYYWGQAETIHCSSHMDHILVSQSVAFKKEISSDTELENSVSLPWSCWYEIDIGARLA